MLCKNAMRRVDTSTTTYHFKRHSHDCLRTVVYTGQPMSLKKSDEITAIGVDADGLNWMFLVIDYLIFLDHHS